MAPHEYFGTLSWDFTNSIYKASGYQLRPIQKHLEFEDHPLEALWGFGARLDSSQGGEIVGEIPMMIRHSFQQYPIVISASFVPGLRVYPVSDISLAFFLTAIYVL